MQTKTNGSISSHISLRFLDNPPIYNQQQTNSNPTAYKIYWDVQRSVFLKLFTTTTFFQLRCHLKQLQTWFLKWRQKLMDQYPPTYLYAFLTTLRSIINNKRIPTEQLIQYFGMYPDQCFSNFLPPHHFFNSKVIVINYKC